MQRGIITFIILFVILAALAYVATRPPSGSTTTTTVPGSSTTVTGASTSQTTLNYSQYLYNCTALDLYAHNTSAVVIGRCKWGGGLLGLWVAAGDAGREFATIRGADNVTYVNQSFTYPCVSFYENVSLPAQIYTVTLRTGTGGGTCGNSEVKLNMTTTAPPTLRDFIYNGDFGTGTYAGWNVTGAGFGTAPMNITHANKETCYIGQPWSGYNGTYFATTFTCGVSTAPGNVTSEPFVSNLTKPFLNFRIISPDDNHLYVEVLEGNVPRIVAHYDTYNSSLGSNASSTFRTASLALGRLNGKALRLRVVADTLNQFRFIAIGDFALSRTPAQQPGIIVNVSYNLTS